MSSSNKVIAIIPARGGSKGLPKKNILDMNGKPLIQWSIEKALNSKLIDKVMVTTDCPDIAEVAKKAGADVPFLRPEHLATDSAGSLEVVNHVLDFYKEQGEEFDFLILLEPTSPLREDHDLDTMIQLLIDNNGNGFDSVISVGLVETPPSILKVKDGKRLLPYDSNLQTMSHRQKSEQVYFPYCVGYLITVDAFKEKQTFYTKDCLHYEIKRFQCFEIDDIYDFLAVENIMRFEWMQNS